MGAKYASKSASGYNASPPADDGSQNASNLVSWATQKSKLADPVKTLADDINTALVSAFDYTVRQITVSDNTVAGDHMRTVEIAPTVSSAITVSLGDAATMTNNYIVRIKNSSTIAQTIGRVTSGDTIDGVAANITLQSKGSVVLGVTSGAAGYLILGGHNYAIYGSTSSTFTFNGSGGTSGSVTLTWQKIGQWVYLHIPVVSATTGTGSTALTSNTALDGAARPSATVSGLYVARNNGASVATPGQVVVTAAGLIELTRDGAGTAFTDGAAAGVSAASPFTLVYYVG